MTKIKKFAWLFILIFVIIFYMADFTWGDLPKSQVDAQLITEAIQEAIDAHNDDPDAHMASGQSIDVHRTNDVIDHPLGSLVGDKFSLQNYVLMPNFEATSLYSIVASSSSFKLGSFDLNTSTVSNNIAYLQAPGASGAPTYDPVYTSTIQFELNLFSTSNVEVYGGAGAPLTSQDGPFVGFKIVGTSLYMCEVQWGPSGRTEYTSLVSGASVSGRHFYRVEIDPVAGIFTFYVDGVSVGTMDIHENDDNELIYFSFSVKTTNTTAKQIRVSGIYFARNYN